MYKWDDWRHASHMYTHNNPMKKTRTHWLLQILSQKKWCDSDWIILTASWVGLHIKLEGKMKKTIAFLQASPTAILPHPIFSPFTRSSSPFPLLWMPATQVIFTCKNALLFSFSYGYKKFCYMYLENADLENAGFENIDLKNANLESVGRLLIGKLCSFILNGTSSSLLINWAYPRLIS